MAERARTALAALLTLAGLALAAPGVALAAPGVATSTTPATPATATPASATAKAKAKPESPVSGWLTRASSFPHRTLVLSLPATAQLTVAQVHITENGRPARPLTLTPVPAATPGATGIVVVLDTSTAAAAGLGDELAAARRLASLRLPGQLMAVVGFAASPIILLGPTASAGAIGRALAADPRTSPGSDPGAAVSTALAQLRHAGVVLGAVVVISDGVGVGPTSTAALRPLTAAAASSHTSVVTLGVEDQRATSASLQALQRSVPGQFALATPAQLPSLAGAVAQGIDRDYLVSWPSRAVSGRPVDVSVTVDGFSGAIAASYQAPGAPPSAARTPPLQAGAATRLSPTPGFPAARAHATSAPASSTSAPASSTPAPIAHPVPVAPPAATGFWSSRSTPLVIAGICGLLIALAVALALNRPRRRSARSRIGSFTPAVSGEVVDPLRPEGSKVSGAFRALARSSWWPPFVEAVEISRNRRSPIELVRIAVALGVVAGVLLGFVSGIPALGLFPILACPFVLRALVRRQVAKQRIKFADHLPSYLQDLASSIRVGRSFVGALAAVAEGADEPTRGEFERAATNEALGLPLEECLDAVSVRMASTDMDQVSLIAGLNRRSGSNVAESLDRVAEGARDRADMKREMRALTAQAKMSSMVLTGLPGVLLLGLSVVSPQYAHPLFHTTLGLVAIGAGAVMCFAGWKVMAKITDVDAV